MVKSLFTGFRKSSDPELTTTFVNLEYGKDGDRTPLLRFEGKLNPKIPIIGIGGAGSKLTDLVVKRLALYNIEYKTMAIDINKNELSVLDSITHKYPLNASFHSSSKQFLKAQQVAKENAESLESGVREYLADFKEKAELEVVFLILGGGGGTGVGVSLEIARFLKEQGLTPVPIVILPGNEESTRVQFNAATALYRFSYAPGDRCLKLPTLCIDNQLFFNANGIKNVVTLNQQINERITAGLGDILVSTELPASGYELDLNEFMEIFRKIKGTAVLTFMNSVSEEELLSLYKNNVAEINSIEADLRTGTRSYVFIQTAKEQLSSKSYRSMMTYFESLDTFPKLSEFGSDPSIMLRAITTGVKAPDRIHQLLTDAEDARVTLLQQEVQNAREGKGNPKIDKLRGDHNIEVLNNEESREIRAQEAAEKRRRGEIS